MSYFDLFETHDLMNDFDTPNNNFEDSPHQSYYNEYLDYLNDNNDDSDYHRYRYY